MNLNTKNINFWPLKAKIIAIIFLCCLVFLAGYMFDIKNLRQRLAKEINSKNSLEKNLYNSRNYGSAQKKCSNRSAALKSAYAVYNNQLQQTIAVSSLVNNIANTADRHGVILTAIQPAVAEKADWLLLRPIAVTATGNYYQLTAFIKALTASPYFILCRDFELTRIKNDHNKLVLKALIIIYSKNLKDQT